MAYTASIDSYRPQSRTSRTGIDSRDIIAFVDQRRQHSVRYNTTIFNKSLDWYRTYRGYWRDKIAAYRNQLSIPFTFSMIQNDVARKVQSVFGSWPIVTFEGYAPEDRASAQKNEVLVSAQMKDCGSVLKAVDFFLQDAICGTAICRYGWKNITRRHRVRHMEEVAPGFSVPVVREYDAEIFNGPDWNPVDRLDFFQQPGKKYIQDMDWVEHRYWMDLDNMLEDAHSDYPYFSAQAVNLLREYPIQGSALDEYQARRLTYRNEFEYMARVQEPFSKPVEIVEYHGLVPSEFAPDGFRARCIAVANNRVVVKNGPAQMPDQSKPFIAYSSMPDPYGFDGISKCSIAENPQRIADRIANQKLDALDSTMDPMYVMNDAVNVNTQNLMTRAGRIILTSGTPDDIKALSPDLRGMQQAYVEVSTLFQYMQLGLGINDILLGSQSASRETARGFLGRQENVLTRGSLETKLAEEGFVEVLANAFRKLNRQFLDTPHEVKILGSLATINPITGYPYEPVNVTVDYDDLAADYRARAVGASQMMGRSVRQQNLVGLFQIMSSNPAMMSLVNWANFARQAFELFDFQNVNELLVNQPTAVNVSATNALTGGGQEGAAGPPGPTSLEQLNPEILGQMLQTQQTAPLRAA